MNKFFGNVMINFFTYTDMMVIKLFIELMCQLDIQHRFCPQQCRYSQEVNITLIMITLG